MDHVAMLSCMRLRSYSTPPPATESPKRDSDQPASTVSYVK